METVDIAKRMVVSERTAKRMVAGAVQTRVTNRIAAAAMAGRFGLLDELADSGGLSRGS